MNTYPSELEPTLTMPEAPTAAAERERSYYGAILWPDGYPGRLNITRRHGPIHSTTLQNAIQSPILLDRETGHRIPKPRPTATIGRWHRPRTG